MKTFILAALVASVVALPQQQQQAAACKIVTKLIPAPQKASATAYCSSYLTLKPRPTTTVVSTAYAPMVTEFITSKVSVVCQAPATTTTTVAQAAPPVKRDPSPGKQSQPKPKPQCLESYKKAQVISSACKCLNIPTGTVTSTSTTTVSSTTKAMVTETIAVPPPRFKLLAVNAGGNGEVLGLLGGSGPLTVRPNGSFGVFGLDAQGSLRNSTYGTYQANQDPVGAERQRGSGRPVWMNTAEDIEEDGYDSLKCKIVPQKDLTCRMVCNDQVNTLASSDDANRKRWQLTDEASKPEGIEFYQVLVPYDGA